MLGALAFLHALGITHCDVKTPNICVAHAATKQFKLIDFGSCVLTYDAHLSYLQSRSYRAPEVTLGGCKHAAAHASAPHASGSRSERRAHHGVLAPSVCR